MRKIFLISVFILSTIANAQPPSRFYTKFGGSGDDIGYSAKQTLDKQYIVAGSTSSFGNTDVYLVKVDSMGVPIWGKNFGGIGNEVGKSVVQLPDSGYVVAGFTNSFGAGGYDALLLRTDKNGNLIWQKTFGGLDWDFANDVVLTPDGDIAVAGTTSSFGNGSKDGMVLKYDYSGNIVWQKFFGGAENEELRSIIVTNDYFLATVGYTESKNDINGDYYFLKLDLSGDTLFTRTYGGPYKDYANDVVQKVGGDYVICGAETFSAGAKTHSSMYSLTAYGSFIWENSFYDSTDDEEFFSNCTVVNFPNFTGNMRSRPKPTFKLQACTFIAIHGGWPYLVNDMGGIEDDFCYSIENTKDGGYISVGKTFSFGSVGSDVFLVKQDSTVINYQSIVGTKENSINKKPILRYLNDNRILFQTNDNAIINYYQVISIDGIIIKSDAKDEGESKLVVDLSLFPKNIFILSITMKDGMNYIYKVSN